MASVTESKEPSADEAAANKQAWGKKVLALDSKAISNEFRRALKGYVAPRLTMAVCQSKENREKCRFPDKPCIDQTRVVLKNREADHDFIHANWVVGPAAGAIKYIACQEPLKRATEDFWHMCFTERVSMIVVFGSYPTESLAAERRYVRYVPQEPGWSKKCGPYTVWLKERLTDPEMPDVRVRSIQIMFKGEVHEVKHLLLRSSWIYGCAPAETTPVLNLWRWVHKHHADRPVVVHSLSGTGRAAVFIGIDFAIQRVAANADACFLDIVKELRAMRHGAIESHVQFVYLHCLLLDEFVFEGIVEQYERSDFVDEYKRHTEARNARAQKQAQEMLQRLRVVPAGADPSLTRV